MKAVASGWWRVASRRKTQDPPSKNEDGAPGSTLNEVDASAAHRVTNRQRNPKGPFALFARFHCDNWKLEGPEAIRSNANLIFSFVYSVKGKLAVLVGLCADMLCSILENLNAGAGYWCASRVDNGATNT